MKKLSAFAACALAALLLAGCSERTYTGILTAPGDETTRSFTMQGQDGTAYSVKVGGGRAGSGMAGGHRARRPLFRELARPAPFSQGARFPLWQTRDPDGQQRAN